MSGFIKLHRSLSEWEWYSDDNAVRLLIHLLISVNYKDKKWRGNVIKKGSMVLSWKTLSQGCHMTIQQCRTAMAKLEVSGEVTRTSTNKYQVVSLVKWEQMQIEEVSSTSNSTNNQQTDNNQITTTKESKERKEGEEINKTPLSPPKGKEDIFKTWLEYRKEIKKPIKSGQTMERLVKKFDQYDLKICESVVNASIENQWQGLFWDKVKSEKPNSHLKNARSL